MNLSFFHIVFNDIFYKITLKSPLESLETQLKNSCKAPKALKDQILRDSELTCNYNVTGIQIHSVRLGGLPSLFRL